MIKFWKKINRKYDNTKEPLKFAIFLFTMAILFTIVSFTHYGFILVILLLILRIPYVIKRN